jgi:hypothetical protein
MVVIPVTQEADIGRIMLPGQPRQKLARPHLEKKLEVVVCTCHPATWEL